MDGNQIWKNDKDELHRDGGEPAMIKTNGEQFWYENGVLIKKLVLCV